jgi:alanyl-tRNA synthetase
MKADILRDKFLDFFRSKKHKVVESDTLAPKDDPTVLFTPAGMNQFKKEFLGFDPGFRRAATSQRCLRTDDLDKVGKTPCHHTFFEMLGNFSFGDYFKEEAISLAWEFLTEELKLKKEGLWVSVYKDDEEAYRIWKDKIKISPEKIVKLGDKENFWPSEAKTKGPNGPCGPCSEIFFDRGKDKGCRESACGPSCSCGRFVEVWNLVFTQFNRKEGGILEPLPQKNIDTGMGLERLAAVMQGVYSNFETDLFVPIIKEIVQSSEFRVQSSKEIIYAIADHLRAIVFAIYDGVLPSNEARGYVVRKLIRKSTMHLKGLGYKQPFLYKLVPVLSQIMLKAYPELDARRENIAEIILAEEKNFISILNNAPDLINHAFGLPYASIGSTANASVPVNAGKIAFQLYDTYGIPLELTSSCLAKYNITIPREDFDQELSLQKSRSKATSSMKGDVFDSKDLKLGNKQSKFSGYREYAVKAKITVILKDDAPNAKKISKGDAARIILDKTVFYPESGGQIGDSGELIKGKNIFIVIDTQKIGKAIVHIGRVKEGIFKTGDFLTAKIDAQRRLAIARNHTSTHILQAALTEVLGKHVKQQGSLVSADKLRFDFTHFKDINPEELGRIEALVNNYILANYSLSAKIMALAAAKKSGALALFGEKYSDQVRVVSIGSLSKELCGGTHLDYTGQIGIFKIIQEGSVASGVRRIEAATGAVAYKIIKDEELVLEDISTFLNTPQDLIMPELRKKIFRLKELEKQLNAERLNLAAGSVDEMIQRAEIIKDTKVIAEVIQGADMDLLRKTIDLIKEKAQNCVIALGSNNQGRAFLVVGVTEDLARKGVDASKLIRQASGLIGGSGGGRKDFAQAGGNKPENLDAAFQELKKGVADLL